MQMQTGQFLKQIVSQRMVQSAQILQLNTVELRAYLQNLALENPLMEFVPPASCAAHRQEAISFPDEQNRAYDRQERICAQDPWNVDVAETLPEALDFQLSGMSLCADRRQILEHMIHNLDSNGYLCVPLQDIQAAFDCDEETVSELLAVLQSLEPYGVGARTLSECLCIQLRRLYPHEQAALYIAQNELELLGKNQLPALARKLHKPLPEILHACDVIRSLNPRPGASYSDGSCMSYLYPELLVRQEHGRFQIVQNDAQPLTVQFNAAYLQMLRDGPEDAVAYLAKKKEQLDWVRQCIAQREQTLLSLGNLIVDVQQSFFQNGPGYLKNFTQAEAAKALDVHESTISRAVRAKYLQCTWGTFPLQYFFPQGMQQRQAISRQIRQMIEREDKFSPLSDQAICSALADAGYTVSKRMVGKYRMDMGLPDAAIRRKYKK